MSDITFYRGDFYPIVATIRDKKTKKSIPIIGSTFEMVVDALAEPQYDNTDTELFRLDGTVSSEDNGIVTFATTAEHTNFTPDTYYYSITMKTEELANRTVVQGQYIITAKI